MLVTFKASASPEEMAGPASDIAQAMLGVKGLVSKTWIGDGQGTVGAFYLFTDKAAADAYLEGDIIAGVKNSPIFSDFNVRHFGVMDDLSALNGTPTVALAERS